MEQDYTLTPEQFAALQQHIADGVMGDETVFFCNAMPQDHLHVRRIGAERAGLGGRVGIMTHSFTGDQIVTYLSAMEARMLAASLLNLADELDGDTPLAFFPPRFVSGPAQDRPDTDGPIADQDKPEES